MKSAILWPQARANLRAEIVYYLKRAGKPSANQLVNSADNAPCNTYKKTLAQVRRGLASCSTFAA